MRLENYDFLSRMSEAITAVFVDVAYYITLFAIVDFCRVKFGLQGTLRGFKVQRS